MAVYRSNVLEEVQSYPFGAGFSISGQVPLGKFPLPSGTQSVYLSVQFEGTPQLSYFKSEKLEPKVYIDECKYLMKKHSQSIPHSAKASASTFS